MFVASGVRPGGQRPLLGPEGLALPRSGPRAPPRSSLRESEDGLTVSPPAPSSLPPEPSHRRATASSAGSGVPRPVPGPGPAGDEG